MTPREFHLNPADYGLPTRDELVDLRIWDSHFHGFYGAASDPVAQYLANNFYVERMGIERSISLEIGGTLANPLTPAAHDDAVRAILETDQDRLSGITPIDPGFPDESCAKMEKWIRNGPCIGIKYVGGNKTGVACSHPNNDPIIRLAAELDATIYIHTWLKVGGTPRLPAATISPVNPRRWTWWHSRADSPMSASSAATPAAIGNSACASCARTKMCSSNSPAPIRTRVRSTTR